MDNPLLHNTWSIHSISRFTNAFSRLSQLEKEASQIFVSDSVRKSRDVDDDSNYVRFSWIDGGGSSSEETKPKTSDATSSGARKRKQDDNDEPEQSQHLRIEIFRQEVWSSEIVLCFASVDQQFHSFDFVLIRGRKSSYEIVLDWLEKRTGCRVGRTPCSFSSSELAEATAIWTRLAHQMVEGSSQQHKPLVVTFQVPPTLSDSGIETLSLKIPPAACVRLCNSIERARPRRRPRNDHEDSGTSDGNTAALDELPVLRALQCFILEAFHMEIRSFPLVMASCDAASLGSDGRCKPENLRLLPHVLDVIRSTVSRRFTESLELQVESEGDEDTDSDD